MRQFDFTGQWYPRVQHIFLDAAGKPAVGPFRLRDLRDVQRYQWTDPDAALADFLIVSADEAGHAAAWYRPLCNARLLEVEPTFESKVAKIRQTLARDGWPELAGDALIALTDLAYTDMMWRFAELKKALHAHDWTAASTLCARRSVGEARNAATAELFRRMV